MLINITVEPCIVYVRIDQLPLTLLCLLSRIVQQIRIKYGESESLLFLSRDMFEKIKFHCKITELTIIFVVIE